MAWQPSFNVLGAGVFAAIGWFVKGLSDDIKQARQDINDHRVYVATNYVTHNHLADIKEALTRIEDKLDRKVDK